MSSDDATDFSSTDLPTENCSNCGDPITHAVGGHEKQTNSCGCTVEPELVTDGGGEPIPHEQYEHLADARDALGKTDDRELPDDVASFVEEAYRKLDWYHDRVEDDADLATDGGTTHAPTYDCRRCDWAGDECSRRDHYPVCPECSRIVDVREELVADGGVPQSFEDLAGTCESCGEDVDPDRLIEGECPGCHYRPDVATDGGVHTVTRDGQEFVVVRQQKFVDDSEMDIGPSGVIRNIDELETQTTIRLLSLDAVRAQELWNRVIGPSDSGWEDEYAELELGESIVPENEEPVTDGGGVSWFDLTAFQRDILHIVAEAEDEAGHPPYGLAIKSDLEARYNEEVNHGRLYPNLDDLVDDDLLEKGELDKRTNYYRLTPRGISMLHTEKEVWSDLSVPEPAVADGGDSA